MKKFMFALLVAVLCSSAMAEVLIYDYAASFKRLDVRSISTKNRAISTLAFNLDSAKVASDKFTGYVAAAACWECSADTAISVDYTAEAGETTPGNYALVYVRRNGNRNAIYRAVGRLHTAMFGANSGVLATGAEHRTDKFTDALGFLSYRIVAGGATGFMGYDQTGNIAGFNWFSTHNPVLAADYDTIDNAGYGKVVAKTSRNPVGGCVPTEIVKTCWILKNLSGNVIGGFTYTGVCSDVLYDLCRNDDGTTPGELDENDTMRPSYAAPINGTFTLKLNNKMTYNGNAMRVAHFQAADTAIKNAMGATAANFYADANETAEWNGIMLPIDQISAGLTW